MRSARGSGRRRPLPRWEVLAFRAGIPAVALACAAIFLLAPARSLWHAGAVGAMVSGCCQLLFRVGSYQWLQILGRQPPADRIS